MDVDKPTFDLIFNDQAQSTVIGYLLTDSSFFIQCVTKIRPGFFNDPKNSTIFRIMLNRYNETKKIPTVLDVQNDPIAREEFKDQNKLNKFIVHVLICERLAIQKEMSLDGIKSGITNWMQGNLFRSAIGPASTAYNSGNVAKALNYIHELERNSKDTLFEDNSRVMFGDFSSYLNEAEQEFDNAIPTGLKLLDEALLGEGAKGGFIKGDMSIVMAPTDAGKTTTLITIAAHNILANNDVLFMTHEGGPKDIRIRILCSILTIQNMKKFDIGEITDPDARWIDRIALIKLNKSLEDRKRIEDIANLIDKKLVYYPYNKPGGMFIEDVEPIIRRLQDDRVSNNKKGFDLLVSDYPAKLGTRQSSQGKLDNWTSIYKVYDYYVQMAIEHGFHSLTAIQTNREGFKINQGKKYSEKRLLTPDDVAGSYDTCTLATNIITVNRDADDGNHNRMTYNLCKSKNSKTSRAIVCSTRFGCRVAHSDLLGAIAYDGQDKMKDSIDEILANPGFRNRLVTPREFLEIRLNDKGVVDANPK